MKQSLHVRLGHHITMTPQLQQAIRLLQLSTLDLQLEIQQTLESNMLLEVNEDELLNDEQNEEKEEATEDVADINLEKADASSEDSPADNEWDETYDTGLSHLDYPTSHGPADGDRRDFTEVNSIPETLHDHLCWQLNLSPFTDVDHMIALIIIDAIDDDGFLRAPMSEILEAVAVAQADITVDLEVGEPEVLAVLHRIQHFDPAGVAARDLTECLKIQLRELDENTPWRAEAIRLVTEFMDLVAGRDYTQLMRKMKLTREELQDAMAVLQMLNPRPGGEVAQPETAYVIPDVFVSKRKGLWYVELNADIAPRLRVNAQYASLIPQVKSKDDSSRMKSHLQEARWFIKSLKSRHDTLLKVTHCIVERQSAFLDYGEEAMKPLVLHDIATELEMHESTISRVTTQKYIHTPRGIFELKYFFSSHVSTSNGGECSSTAIRALIKKLIAAEDNNKPLSDNKIANLLGDQGIQVARRTVAKYREAMTIPPSNERKYIV